MKKRKIQFKTSNEKTLIIIILTLFVLNIVLLGINRSLSNKLIELSKLNEKIKTEKMPSLTGQKLISIIASFIDMDEYTNFLNSNTKIILFIKVYDCPSCKMTLYNWNYVRQYFKKKIQFIGIFQNADLLEIDKFKEEFHIQYKTIIDSSCDFFRFLSIETATPAAVILNRKNEVIAVETPYTLPPSRDQYIEILNKLMERNID